MQDLFQHPAGISASLRFTVRIIHLFFLKAASRYERGSGWLEELEHQGVEADSCLIPRVSPIGVRRNPRESVYPPTTHTETGGG